MRMDDRQIDRQVDEWLLGAWERDRVQWDKDTWCLFFGDMSCF